MKEKAFQDYYPDDLSYCYGCGRLNEDGLQIKSYWEGDESVCVFTPRPHHMAVPGFVYGGLIASLIDCHGTGTAAAAAYRAAGRLVPLEGLLGIRDIGVRAGVPAQPRWIDRHVIQSGRYRLGVYDQVLERSTRFDHAVE